MALNRGARPRLLDLFCGAGGAAEGYHRAGFDVVGVDIAPQPHYPFPFVRMDVLEYLKPTWLYTPNHLAFDAIHASPPCQAHAITQNIWHNQDKHPDLIEPTRKLLRATGLPYVIENVPGAPLLHPIVLCGESFGLGVIRHRLFESSVPMWAPPHKRHRGKASYGHKPTAETVYMTVSGHYSDVPRARIAMGIDWMTRDELAQAIPPAYTEFIGKQLRDAVSDEAVRQAWDVTPPGWGGRESA
jgi:DNA (cytosine-5)-methyltransferase 1